MIKSSSPAVKSKSYTAAVKVSTSNKVIQTDLTTVKISIKRFQILKKTHNRLQKQINKIQKQHRCLDSNSWAPVSLCQKKTPKKQSKDSGPARFKKAEKQLVLTNNLHETLGDMDDLMDR